MHAESTPQHDWLMRLVGSWDFEHEYDLGGEKGRSTGSEVIRRFGSHWIIGEMTGVVSDGTSMDSVLTLGFDPRRGRFVGTWIGSPFAHLWVYEGVLEVSSDTLTLDTRGPAFEDPAMLIDYQDIVTLEDG
ncbi:MAG: DUF1579 family protein, partial [Planctomycetota bacterium]